MRQRIVALLLLAAAEHITLAAAQLFLKTAPVKLIIDTDIGGGGCKDVDDVLAIAIANALQDNGEAELLAVVQNTAPTKCAGVISVLNHYYGRDTIPIGAYNVATPNATLIETPPLDYVNLLVDQFDHPLNDSSQAEDSVQLYRRVLAGQPDYSVTISSIGIHTNLAALLKSPPDSFSPLDGRALVAKKVFRLAVMGGGYPSGHECNLCGGWSNVHNSLTASQSSSYVASNWPSESKILWSGVEVGGNVQSGGAGFQKCKIATDASPVKVAMVSYEGGPNLSRCSWDPLTTLIAVRGVEAGFCTEAAVGKGKNVIDPKTGKNQWVLSPPGEQSNQSYLLLQDAEKAGQAIDALLCQVPKTALAPRMDANEEVSWVHRWVSKAWKALNLSGGSQKLQELLFDQVV